MIRQVCLYLTRKCNVTCRYCNVIKYRKPGTDNRAVETGTLIKYVMKSNPSY